MTSLGFPAIQPDTAQSTGGRAAIVLVGRSLGLNIGWTFAGNVIYAACQWGMLVTLAKMGSPEMVGRFALALAITAPVYMLTNLQLRAVEATDVANQFAFGDYLGLRILCTGIALATIIGFAAISHDSLSTAAVIVLVGLAKGAESISDAIYGLVQRHERMDLIACSMVWKGVVSLAAFALAIALTGKLVLGVAALAAAWCVVLILYDFSLARRFARESPMAAFAPRFSASTLSHLTRLSLPLGITAMLGSLILTVPRYFIQDYAGARSLGFFAAIAYLMVGGNLVTNAIGQSATPRLASFHASGNAIAFRGLLVSLCGIAAIPGIAGILIAIKAGKPVLRLLYRADYQSYSDIFTLLMIAAAIYYLTSILGYVITAARIFKPQPVLFAVIILVSVAACVLWVPMYGLRGAAFAQIVAAATELTGFLVILLPALRTPSLTARIRVIAKRTAAQ
jgi:O-antigen/teichoic acid export membrane protein